MTDRPSPDLFGHLPDDQGRKPKPPVDIEDIANAIWRGGVDPVGTLTETYFTGLGLTLSDEVCGEVIRHHGSLHFSQGRRLPGMIALLRDFHDDKPVAISRTYLDERGHKIAHRLLGRAYKAAAKLDGRITNSLHITIGIETGIAAMAMNLRPVWSVGSAETLANLPLLAAVETLTILTRSNDSNATRAAEHAAMRWRQAGRNAQIVEVRA